MPEMSAACAVQGKAAKQGYAGVVGVPPPRPSSMQGERSLLLRACLGLRAAFGT